MIAQARATRWVVGKNDEAISVEIDDQGAGEYVVIEAVTGEGSVAINPEEWTAIRAAIDFAMEEIKRHEESEKAGEN